MKKHLNVKSTTESTRARGISLDPTPPEVFFDRRQFVGALAASGFGIAAGLSSPAGAQPSPIQVPFERPDVFPAKRNEAYAAPPAGVPKDLTVREIAASHNNFYEFLPGRGGPVVNYIQGFEVQPWKIEVSGECNNPMTLDLDDLFAFEHEERVYHFRCVERWSMNVPWSGFPLKKLIEKADPKSSAKYVRFETLNRPEQMPGITSNDGKHYPWPYFEALRMDESMHDLAFAVTGAYGDPLLKQHGAPIRIAVPWKYGYKNPKSIAKIEFVKDEPNTFWQVQPHEYGFLSNVNPNIPHPRWSQATSFWLGTEDSFDTPLFNGYAEQVAGLYPDEPMKLQKPLRPGQRAR
ncbi:MAG: protein-methionine-sulfoxide reductase catalytic subunit MsrP [Acidobacteriota bacterium]